MMQNVNSETKTQLQVLGFLPDFIILEEFVLPIHFLVDANQFRKRQLSLRLYLSHKEQQSHRINQRNQGSQSYAWQAFRHSIIICSKVSWQPSQLMIETIVTRGPHLPVNDRPKLALVLAQITGILEFCAIAILVCTWSSTPPLQGFLSTLKATTSSLAFFFQMMVVSVRLHSFKPETIIFLALSCFCTLRIACLQARRFTKFSTRSSSCSDGQFVTHQRMQVFLWVVPVSLPMFLQAIFQQISYVFAGYWLLGCSCYLDGIYFLVFSSSSLSHYSYLTCFCPYQILFSCKTVEFCGKAVEFCCKTVSEDSSMWCLLWEKSCFIFLICERRFLLLAALTLLLMGCSEVLFLLWCLNTSLCISIKWLSFISFFSRFFFYFSFIFYKSRNKSFRSDLTNFPKTLVSLQSQLSNSCLFCLRFWFLDNLTFLFTLSLLKVYMAWEQT